MKRYEMILTLRGLEEQRLNFKALLNDVSDYYFKTGSLSAQLTTNQYDNKRTYKGELILFDEDLFKDYLKKEIEKIECRIEVLIDDLRGAK